ncbi:hypothetical protein GQ600_2057 [Phytophthora cactorum]|nr:hypothetical protein GQ600_2057 [Phytophthora cactorum]
MGAKQSRVVTSEVAAELRPEDEHERETRASIHLTPALIDQINGTHNAPKKAAGGLDAQYAAITYSSFFLQIVICYIATGSKRSSRSRCRWPTRRCDTGVSLDGDVELLTHVRSLGYLQGADDYRKKMEAELKQKEQQASTSAPSLAQQAQFAKEQEERENERVEQLVAEINKKKYRAPLRDVQCSSEREACLQCYRDEKSDVLKCKEVADAFVRCARQNTEVRLAARADLGIAISDTCVL